MMQRRDFIAGVGVAVATPWVARSQQSGRVRRIGVLMGGAESDPVIRAYFTASTSSWLKLGWMKAAIFTLTCATAMETEP